jgi:Flp pilus assembly CpaF family ATPase
MTAPQPSTGWEWPPAWRPPAGGLTDPPPADEPPAGGQRDEPAWYEPRGEPAPEDLPAADFLRAARAIFRDAADDLAKFTDRDAARQTAERAVRTWAAATTTGRGRLLAPATQVRLVTAVLDERFGLGPVQQWVDDGNVENIDINGQQVWLSLRNGGKRLAPPVASDDGELIQMVRDWGLQQGQTPREFSASRPIMTAALRSGVRLTAIMSVSRHVHVSIRIHRLVDVTLDQLAGPAYRTITPELRDFLAATVRAHKNIIVTGATNAGKTTLLRALAAAIDPDERIATLETDYELQLDQLPGRHHDVVALEARQANSEGAGGITLHDLIPAALRLNPRRILVGEARDTEVRALIEAMNSGHEGSMTTIHANSPAEVFARIQMLALRGNVAMAAQEIHLAVGMSRPFVVHVRVDAAGSRYVSEVIEVLPPADGIFPSSNRVFVPGEDGRAEFRNTLTDEAARDLAAVGFDPDVFPGGFR